MRLSLAVRRERAMLQRIREVYWESSHFAHTHEQHLAAMKRYIWDTPEYRMAPRWLKSACYGADHTMFDSLYSTGLNGEPSPLASVSIGPDGRMFGEKDDTWLQESTEYKLALKCTHVWRYRWEQGEFKPWS